MNADAVEDMCGAVPHIQRHGARVFRLADPEHGGARQFMVPCAGFMV